ncbi:hypothetical protein [Streptomyces levis]|uniref:hypothetical protein n=1 Tax=Streptomyces levis TaxID=285566 RepID=UPI0031E031A1
MAAAEEDVGKPPERLADIFLCRVRLHFSPAASNLHENVERDDYGGEADDEYKCILPVFDGRVFTAGC